MEVLIVTKLNEFKLMTARSIR